MRGVNSCDPGGGSDDSRMAVYQALSIECPSTFFWHMLCVVAPCFFVVFVFFFVVLILSLELCRCSSDLFLSSRSRNGLATAHYWVWLRPDRLM